MRSAIVGVWMSVSALGCSGPCSANGQVDMVIGPSAVVCGPNLFLDSTSNIDRFEQCVLGAIRSQTPFRAAHGVDRPERGVVDKLFVGVIQAGGYQVYSVRGIDPGTPNARVLFQRCTSTTVSVDRLSAGARGVDLALNCELQYDTLPTPLLGPSTAQAGLACGSAQ